MHRKTALSLFLIAVGAVAAPCRAAQAIDAPAAPDLLDAMAVRQATLQQLEVPARSDRSASIDVVLAGQRRTLDVEPVDLRASGFKLLVQTGGGVREAAPAAARTLRGRVRGSEDSRVGLNLVAGGAEAVVVVSGETWWIVPVGEGRHIVFRDADMLDRAGARCGVHGHRADDGHFHDPTGGGPIFQAAEIYIDCDHSYHVQHGGGLPQVTQQAAINQLNLVNVLYEGQLGLTHKVNGVYVQAIFNQYSAGASGTFADMSTLLGQLATFWNTHPQFSILPRDVVHHFSGKGTWSGTVGIANIGVICSVGLAYGVSRTVHPTNPAFHRTLIAHELGHNWNALHCDGVPGCGIMNSIIGTSVSFGPSAAAISAFASTRTCLSSAAYATYSAFGAGCPGSSGLAPAVGTTDRPLIGQSFTMEVSQCPASAPVSFIVGFSNTSWNGIPLPLNLGFFQMPGCSLLVSVDLTFPSAANASGSASLTVPIANQASLIGFCFFTQVSVFDLAANPRGLTVSNGAAGVAGNL